MYWFHHFYQSVEWWIVKSFNQDNNHFRESSVLWGCWYWNLERGGEGIIRCQNSGILLQTNTTKWAAQGCLFLNIPICPSSIRWLDTIIKGNLPTFVFVLHPAPSEGLWLLTSNWMLMWVLNEARLPVVQHGVCKWPIIIRTKSQMGAT